MYRLFKKAFESRPFDALCTVLRVKGMYTVGWDAFEESLDAFDDFNWLLQKSVSERGDRCARRIMLLIYCQTIEMTAVHEMLANLLHCMAGKPYVINPFKHLVGTRKKVLSYGIPPSAKQKFREIKRFAKEAHDENLPRYIDLFFNDQVRNAFSHSDYVLTDREFRGGDCIGVGALDHLIGTCLDFYEAFITSYKRWLVTLCRGKRYHKWPNYEVLELLPDKNESVYGFNVHFSNGSEATFSRTRSGIEAINLSFEQDGTVNFFSGNLDKLEPVWKVNGERILDWNALENNKRQNDS